MKSIDIYIFDVERKLVSNMSEAPIHRSEEAVHRCSTKKAFLKISQNSQESTCTGISFQENQETRA